MEVSDESDTELEPELEPEEEELLPLEPSDDMPISEDPELPSPPFPLL